MKKEKLRKCFKNHCSSFVFNNKIQILSDKVQGFLKALDWSNVRNAAVYHPFKDEVPVSEFVKKHSHIKWLYPQSGQFFFKSPHSSVHPVDDIDLFLVPGLAFDHQCRRLGRGSGFYDRVLSQNDKALKIGISWSVQISSSELPEEAHDVRMDACVNEKFFLFSSCFFDKYRRSV